MARIFLVRGQRGLPLCQHDGAQRRARGGVRERGKASGDAGRSTRLEDERAAQRLADGGVDGVVATSTFDEQAHHPLEVGIARSRGARADAVEKHRCIQLSPREAANQLRALDRRQLHGQRAVAPRGEVELPEAPDPLQGLGVAPRGEKQDGVVDALHNALEAARPAQLRRIERLVDAEH